MWTLDATNSSALFECLRPHARRFELSVLGVGEGWRPLVEEIHWRVEARFPEYELWAVKQKWGLLEFQAFPRPWSGLGDDWSTDEWAELDNIVDPYRARSALVCEWCGAAARLRTSRTYEMTLCDTCDAEFADPPVPGWGQRE